jgi:hypothetical protein
MGDVRRQTAFAANQAFLMTLPLYEIPAETQGQSNVQTTSSSGSPRSKASNLFRLRS